MSELIQEILIAFVIGGAICLLGQLFLDVLKLTPAHTMSAFVVIGSILGIFGFYRPLVDRAGMGAALPIVSFGNLLVEGAVAGAAEKGFWGIWTGILQPVSLGIAAAVFFAFIGALLFKPKS